MLPMSNWETLAEGETDDDDVPAVTTGDMRDGETLTLTFDAEPETFESDQYGEGVRFPATFEQSDYRHTNDEGDDLIDGDDVVLVTWSSRLVSALSRHKADHGLVGETVTVRKHGNGMQTEYTAESR